MRLFLRTISTVVAVLLLASCGDDDAGHDDAGSGGTITVFAAASLREAFADVADAFQAANPGVSVEFSFAGSSSLREQILGGAPADVFASANESTMDQVIEAGEVAGSEIFAVNRLQIVVPAGNPAGITGLDDFGDSELLLGLCAAEVPCGNFARQALGAAGVTPSVDTNEPSVRALLAKVEAGELDAGLVYVTDVISAGRRVDGIDLPRGFNVVAAYSIGTVTSSTNPDDAAAFVDFVLADEGQAVLQEYGFGRP